MPDFQIDGFELIERLGEGGSSTVWKARQVSLDRTVAIKTYSVPPAQDPSVMDRFRAEALSAAKLKHNGIVQVYDAGVHQGTVYIVMEYVAGYTVGEWLRRKGQLSESDALLVAECVADALQYAWDKERIVHCDIKPDNIFIDADGAVKVGDLGLARIGAVEAEASDEVTGTPAYISPEQAMGEPSLDFRADIYSLGATLYHLVSGRHLFHGRSEDDLLQLQVSGQDEDPTDANPSVSVPMSALIEIMLAKKPADRHPSWQAVRDDLALVRKGRLPRHVLTKGTISSVARSTKRRVPGTRRRRPAKMPATEMSSAARPFVVLVTIGIGALLAIVIVAASMLAARHSSRPMAAPAAGTRTEQLPAYRPEQQDRAKAEAAILWEKTSLWLKANRGDYEESLRRLMVVASQAAGTRYALEAEAEIRRLKFERRKSADDVIRQLGILASPHILERRFDEAAAVYEGYSGPLASETWTARADAARQLRARQSEEASSAASSPSDVVRIDECMTGLAKLLLSEGSVAGLSFLSAQLRDPVFAAPSSGMAAVREIVSEAADTDARILDSFKAQCGLTGTVYLNTGPRTLTVNAVEDGVIKATQSAAGGAAGIGITFSLRDLSLRERLARMGDDSRPGVSLEKGLMALRSASKNHAKAFFDKLPDPLKSALMAEIGAESVEAGAASEQTNDQGSPVDPQALQAAILDRNKTVTPAEVVITRRSDGSIREIRIVSPFLSDISPIADAGSVDSVVCSGADPADNLSRDSVCILQDISPLRRVSMNSLNIALTSVKDLTPLRGAQLRSLNIRSTGVSDLGPLAGMPLERLNIRFNPVKSLTPLRGMRLKVLDAYGTDVSDLSPIRRMPLESLDMGRTVVRTLVPLKDMPLRHLNLSGTRVFDFSQIRGMPLETLDLSDTQFRDTALLSGMPLRRLILARTNVGDLRGISGTRLEELDVAGTVIGNVSVLAGMPLRSLNLSGTRVTDLSPLSQSPLVSLDVSGTEIRDLEPLSGLRALRSLNLNGTDVRILHPLMGLNIESLDIRGIRSKEKGVLRRLPLKHLWADKDDEDVGMNILRAIPTLKTLNGQPVNRW